MPLGERPRGPLLFALALCAAIASTLLLDILALALGGTIAAWQILLGFAIGLTLATLLVGGSVRGRLLAAAAVLAVVGCSAAAATLIYDLSYDGQWYHQLATDELRHGWNPLRGRPHSLDPAADLWLEHYPRAAWYLGASLAGISGSLETGKVVGLWLAIASVGAAYSALRVLGASVRRSALAALLAAANPVVISQLATGYVDGCMYSAFLVAAAASILVARRARGGALLAASALVVLLNLKLSGVLFVALAAAIGVVATFTFGGALRRLLTVYALGVLAGLAVGVDPYLTNWLRHGHPLFPLAGARPLDILEYNLPHAVLHGGAWTKLVHLVAASLANDPARLPPLHGPLLTNVQALGAYAVPDNRFGGFGPLGGVTLVFATLVGILSAPRRTRPLLIAVAALVWGSALAVGQYYWARYAPQLWLLLPLPCLVAPSSRAAKIVAALAALDVVLVALGWSVGSFHRERDYRRAMAQLSLTTPALISTSNMPGTRLRLEAAGVEVREVARGSCHAPRPLPFTTTLACAP